MNVNQNDISCADQARFREKFFSEKRYLVGGGCLGINVLLRTKNDYPVPR